MTWNFDPEFISLGPVTIHWYGLLFSAAILLGYALSHFIFSRECERRVDADRLLTYVVLGVILGARVGHCLFYDPHYYFANPFKILAVWEGGLASHGGGLGAILGIWLYSRRSGVAFSWLMDRIVISAALFGFFVRVANFLNSEIVGSESHLPWAVVFVRLDTVSRHPAQLYEAVGYLLLFLVMLWLYFKKGAGSYRSVLTGVFLTMAFSIRFLVEFIKETQASYTLSLGLNVGQLLSLPFFMAGIVILCFAIKNPSQQPLLRKRGASLPEAKS